MFYSKSAEYGIRLLGLFVVERGDAPLKIKQISASSGVPESYAAKVLLALVKKKFLRSVPGPQGGFLKNVDVSKLTLYQVIAAIDDFPRCRFVDCVMGFKDCDDKNPCVLHDVWMKTKKEVMDILANTTMQQLVESPSIFRNRKNKRIELSQSMRNIFGHYDKRK